MPSYLRSSPSSHPSRLSLILNLFDLDVLLKTLAYRPDTAELAALQCNFIVRDNAKQGIHCLERKACSCELATS